MIDPKQPSRSVSVTPSSGQKSPALSGKPLPSTQTRPGLSPSLDAETIQKLRLAGIIYGVGAVGIFLVGVGLVFGGDWPTALMVLIPAVILGAISWQCLKRIL